MSNEQIGPTYSLDDLAEIVWREGLEYAIECYVTAENITDPVMRAVWMEAEKAIKKVRDLLPSDEEE